MANALKVALVGAGHRGELYASYALKHPDEMQVTAVVDPNPLRRDRFAALHGIPAANRFDRVEELVGRKGMAEAAINGTMDSLHVPTTLPLLEAGYDVLLEKPIVTRAADLDLLREAAKRNGRTVMICHVLRYAPFYVGIRRRIAAGEIGEVMTIETNEHVSYHHMAVGFVRGKWNREDRCGSTMLMAKCCHDLDLIAWMKSGISPVRVHSFGGLMEFHPGKAPAGSGTRCLTDCRIEATCPYSAKTLYVDQGLWKFYAWEGIEHLGKDATREQKLESLKTDNPMGRCVWRCDNDVVDHQNLVVQFADGSVASHTMVGGTARACRSVHIVGSKGEIQGVMEDGSFVVRTPAPAEKLRYREEKVQTDVGGDMHGGGDLRLVEDFVRKVRGAAPSISSTVLEDSLNGARIAFAADESRVSGRAVDVKL